MVSIFIQESQTLNLYVENISQENYSGHQQNVFPAPNISNIFPTSDYDALIITKIDYKINHVFRSMTVQ